MTNDNYEIKEIDDFLTPQECELITQLSSDKLFKSRVYSATADVESNVRDSEQCWLKNDAHELIRKISERVAAITETKIEDQEELQVVKYKPGGYYRPHYDACDWRKENCDRFNGDKGPRFITFIIYLNDDFECGETEFVNLQKKFQPIERASILFYSLDKKREQCHPYSLHQGNPVILGNKYIVNIWMRQNKFIYPLYKYLNNEY